MQFVMELTIKPQFAQKIYELQKILFKQIKSRIARFFYGTVYVLLHFKNGTLCPCFIVIYWDLFLLQSTENFVETERQIQISHAKINRTTRRLYYNMCFFLILKMTTSLYWSASLLPSLIYSITVCDGCVHF